MGRDVVEAKMNMRVVLAAPLLLSGLLASGCVSSPTYGTSKSANAQLTSDLAGMFSMRPKPTAVAEYKPRPELVQPASLAELPQPQDSIATSSNPAWPESPEQRRARIRAEATANQDARLYDTQVINDLPVAEGPRGALVPSRQQDEEAKPMSSGAAKAAGAEVRRRRAEVNQGSPTSRKYLSEPPLEYRMPAATASVDDLGEDEAKKERRIRKEASKKDGSRWRDMIPWL